MDYLERRRDIAEGIDAVLPGAKSAIVLALPYKSEEDSTLEPAPRGRISLYACGRDYHRSFEKRMKKLVKLLREYGDTPKAYVDYGPVMERAYAQSAGLGFIGKNNCLINPTWGSWIFLGVILSRLELPVGRPISMDCGDCERCLKACPSGALKAPFCLDAGKCISYHSVENREEIPLEIRPLMGRWILGCDACQQVCPYNNGVPLSPCADFSAPRLPRRPSLSRFFNFNEESFLEAFAGTAAMRPGRRGLARNAAIAAANAGDIEFLPDLVEALAKEPDQNARIHMKWAIQKLREMS